MVGEGVEGRALSLDELLARLGGRHPLDAVHLGEGLRTPRSRRPLELELAELGVVERETGPVGAAIADPLACIELIADGIHVDPTIIRTLFAAAPERIVLVTDAMAAAATAPGRYRLGSLDVDVADGRAVIAGTDTLAGSTLTMDRAVEVCVAAGVPRELAEAAARDTPRWLLRV